MLEQYKNYATNFTALSYQAMRDEVISYLKAAYADAGLTDDFQKSSFISMCVDAHAYVGSLLAQRIDDNFAETQKDTVQSKDNLVKLMNLMSLRIMLPHAAQLKCEALLQKTVPGRIILPARYKLTATDNTGKSRDYELMKSEGDYYSNVTLYPGSSSYDLTFYDGRTYRETFVSSGSTKQSYLLSKSSVIEGSIQVSVSPITPNAITTSDILNSRISEVNNLVTTNSDIVYKISVLDNNIVQLDFAIDNFGTVPPANYYIYVDYRVGGGSAGNLDVGTALQTFNLTDEFGNNTILTVTNGQNAGTGGSDGETIDQIKDTFEQRTQSINRIDNRSDYIPKIKKALNDLVQDIYVLDYHTDKRLNSVRSVAQNAVHLYILLKTGEVMSPAEYQIVSTTLEDLRLTAIENYPLNPYFNDWAIEATIYYQSWQGTEDELRTKIENALMAEYGATSVDSNGNTYYTYKLGFMKIINRSKVIKLIQDTITNDAYLDLTLPSMDINPTKFFPPKYGMVNRLTRSNIHLNFVMVENT